MGAFGLHEFKCKKIALLQKELFWNSLFFPPHARNWNCSKDDKDVFGPVLWFSFDVSFWQEACIAFFVWGL